MPLLRRQHRLAFTRRLHRAALGLGLGLLSAAACGPSVPGEWADFVPKDGLNFAFGAEDDGKIKKVALNYKGVGMTGDLLRGKFTGLIEKGGFSQVSECVNENGTSSAIYVSEEKEVFQVAINLLGEEFYDVGLNRGKGLPGIELPDPATCKWTGAAEKFCESTADARCKFK